MNINVDNNILDRKAAKIKCPQNWNGIDQELGAEGQKPQEKELSIYMKAVNHLFGNPMTTTEWNRDVAMKGI